jgi:predicted MFS family arabinose efflux permease
LGQKAQRKGLLFSLVVLFAINILNFYDRHVPGALVEPMRKEFHLTDTQVGLLGSAFIWLYAIVGVPLGYLADSWSRKKLLAWGVVVWASLTASAAFATNYALLLFSRLGVGLGEATCAPTATSWLGRQASVRECWRYSCSACRSAAPWDSFSADRLPKLTDGAQP